MLTTDLSVPNNALVSDQIANDCEHFIGAAKEALDWINDPRNGERIHPDKQVLEQDLRRAAFQARKLEKTVRRPMCVGVFGPSQAGKSYLVSVLARKDSNSVLTAVFDDPAGPVDFISKINPSGDKEATGLVTRFTMRSIKTPPGFPVVLRLLNQTDMVKILVNSYANDGDIDAETAPNPEEIIAHIKTFESAARKDGYNDVLREEDIWDLQDYIQQKYKRINSYFAPFWDQFAFLAPRLTLSKRAELFSALWGMHEPLTSLYAKTVEGISRLGFADDAFCQVEALIPSANSILNVDTLNSIGADDTSLLQLMSSNGVTAQLPRSVVAAITAELCIVVAEKPKDFFDHTDILDFPGYRSRKKDHLSKAFALAREYQQKEMLLRGKVDYLFQRYTADQELTSILLCVPDSTLEVKTLPAVIEEWVGLTHGASPESRIRRPNLLFFCLTKFDRHFAETAGDTADLGGRFSRRMESSLLKDFGGGGNTWPMVWTPGHPFNNCFWIRNPNFKSEGIIEYENWNELRILPIKIDYIARLKQGHNSQIEIKEHFSDPARAWDEVMKLNDGGVGYLIESLAAVCLPGIKEAQVVARLEEVRKKIADKLARYYISTDMAQRLRERQAVCAEILKDIELCFDQDCFGSLISELCIDRVDLSDELYVARTTAFDGKLEPSTSSYPLKIMKKGSITGAISGDDGGGAPSPAKSENSRLAATAIQAWATNMTKRAESASFARSVGVQAATLREIAVEISAAARRKKLGDVITQRLDLLTHIEKTDTVIAKATVVAETILNRFVATMGYDDIPIDKRPLIGKGETRRPIFAPRVVVHDAKNIGQEPEAFGFSFAVDWCAALNTTVVENASTQDGLMQDPIQNERLGLIINSLQARQ